MVILVFSWSSRAYTCRICELDLFDISILRAIIRRGFCYYSLSLSHNCGCLLYSYIIIQDASQANICAVPTIRIANQSGIVNLVTYYFFLITEKMPYGK